jgi:redox-sensitive bicupin YhaK (pirin superfamily)
MIYVMEGRGAAGPDGRPVASGDLAIFRRDGGIVRFQAGDVAMSLLLLAGRPIGEPVARYGPFVMNTREELVRAVEDYRAGRLGSISP